jgi:hypothetical protein
MVQHPVTFSAGERVFCEGGEQVGIGVLGATQSRKPGANDFW